MSATFMYYRPALLPWNISEEEEERFRRILKRVLLFCLIVSVLMPWLPLPKPDPTKVEELPPRYAKDVKVIQLDIEPEEIHHNKRTEVPLVGDGKAIMAQMNKALASRSAAR